MMSNGKPNYIALEIKTMGFWDNVLLKRVLVQPVFEALAAVGLLCPQQSEDSEFVVNHKDIQLRCSWRHGTRSLSSPIVLDRRISSF